MRGLERLLTKRWQHAPAKRAAAGARNQKTTPTPKTHGPPKTQGPPKSPRSQEADYGLHQLDLRSSSGLFQLPQLPVPRPTHNVLVCSLVLEAAMPDHLDFFAFYCRYVALGLRLACTPVIHVPDQHDHWTVIRGPFVHAKTKENFERRRHARALQLYDASPAAVDQWVALVRASLPMGVDLRATRFGWETPGFAAAADKRVAAAFDAWVREKLVEVPVA